MAAAAGKAASELKDARECYHCINGNDETTLINLILKFKKVCHKHLNSLTEDKKLS